MSSQRVMTTDRKVRLDVLLLQRGLTESRERARALILAGDVRVNGQTVSRPGASVPSCAEVTLPVQEPYASRGALKLAHALDTFDLSVDGLTILDVGASTGGFTDVLLRRGSQKVYAVDVGYGQLAWRLRQDPRVVVMERTNIRYLTNLPEPPDAAVIDVSFISLSLVIPPVLHLLKAAGWIVALIKPQFEAGREQVGKGGVVRDPRVHRAVLQRVLTEAMEHGLAIGGCIPSPIIGPAGNREFLALLRRTGVGLTVEDAIATCLDQR